MDTSGAAPAERAEDKDPTLHQRILGDVEARILSGEWKPGHRIPFETDLAAQYGCSRMTVNKVMTQLARAGLITRRKRSGSFVAEPRAQSAVLEIHDIEAEVRSLKQAYAFRILSRAKRRARTGEDALLDDVSPGGPLVEVSCMHYAGPRPFCLEERLINLASVPEAAAADFAEAPPGRWLLGQVPWSRAEHRIRAMAAEGRVAAALEIPAGAACLVVERRTWSGAGSVTHVRLTYPGDRHALLARFTPSG